VSRIALVSGALANKPLNGGEAWVRLSWIRAFERACFRTFFIEQAGAPLTPAAVDYFNAVTGAFGLQGRCALVTSEPPRVIGMTKPALRDLLGCADVLLNISGNLHAPDLLSLCRRKVYLDIDPGYTQIWHEQKLAPIAGHDFYFTIAENIGQPDCAIPTNGIEWRTIRQPVVLDDWPVTPPPAELRFTTVAAWRGSFGSVTYGGKTFGQKAHEFRRVLELPKHCPAATFEIALQIHAGDTKDRAALEGNGWRLTDPAAVAPDPQSFRRYVENSSAEFSVAQGIYVDTNSGWFSDRTIKYLAAGRPALVQETGFSRHFGDGCGLVPFRNLDEAAAGAEAIARDYAAHACAARALAEEVFDSNVVLTKLLRDIGISVSV
jgi:hypothetical protein